MDRKNQIAMTGYRLETKAGHTDKDRHYMTNIAVVTKYLVGIGMTVDFKSESQAERDLGCLNIWMKIAYAMALDERGTVILKPSQFERFQSVSRYWRSVRSSIYRLREELIKDHQIALFIVRRSVDKKMIEIITDNPDYPVNDAQQTALDIAMAYGERHIQASLKRCVEQYERMTGNRKPGISKMREILNDLQRQSLAPAMLPLDFSDEPKGPIAANGA